MTSTSQASVELAQFAAVQAAEQDAMPIEDVLDREGIDESRWPEARKTALLDIASSAAALKAHQLAVPTSRLTPPLAGGVSRDEPPASASIDETFFLDGSALRFGDDALSLRCRSERAAAASHGSRLKSR
jgi:hypothetical protein